jgi:hypothetical protein
MAAPSLPDRDDIATAIAARTGNSAAANSEFYTYLEEVKSDIASVLPGGLHKSLMTTAVSVLTPNDDYIQLPSDLLILPNFEKTIVRILSGTTTGAFQAGSTTTAAKLAADDINDVTLIERLRVLVTSGDAIRGIGTCTGYNVTTDVATLNPALGNGAPADGDDYLIVDTSSPVEPENGPPLGAEQQSMSVGLPKRIFISQQIDESGTVKKVGRLRPAPDSAYGIEIQYSLDITQLDLTSSALANLYQTWRNLWIQGGVWRKLMDDRDSTYVVEREQYTQYLTQFAAREGII